MLLQQLADYAIREQTSKLPPQVIHHAKRAVIDWYAALLPGSIVNPAKLMEEALPRTSTAAAHGLPPAAAPRCAPRR